VGARLGWSAHLRQRCAGAALKGVLLRFTDAAGQVFERRGECVLTETGLEGSLIYAASARLRDTIEAQGRVRIELDLKPDWSRSRLQAELARERGGQSLGTLLRKRVGLTPAQVALLHEVQPTARRVVEGAGAAPADGTASALHHETEGPAPVEAAPSTAQSTAPSAADWAALIQNLPLDLVATRPLAEAISSAGGVVLEGLNEALMLHQLPGVFCAGEMLDWDAPTGGYLLTACLASGRVAGLGLVDWLQTQARPNPN